MAFFTPSLSPAVVTREIDLTGYVPNVGTTTGVFAGNFRWGPVDVPTYVFNEADLVEKFASPDTNNSVDFHSAAYFSKYSDQLLVIRALDSGSSTALNAYHVDTVSSFANVVGSTRDSNAPAILNEADFDNRRGTVLDTASTGFHGFLAKYPGTLGNSLDIQICPFNTGADSAFTSWGLVNSFNEAPATSPFATGKTATNDEVHVAVVDRGGEFTGTKGTVLEAFPFVSLASNAKNADGSTNYIADVINNQSSYVWLADAANLDSDY